MSDIRQHIGAILALIALTFLCARAHPVAAQTLSGRFYDEATGLSDPSPMQMLQLANGASIVLTQGETLLFDGQRFLKMGNAQGIHGSSGLRQVGLTSDGRFVVGSQGNRLLIADITDPHGTRHGHLAFTEVPSPGRKFVGYDLLAAYGHGMVVSTLGNLSYLDIEHPDRPALTALPAQIAAAATILSRATNLLGDGRRLWGALPDGRICMVGDDTPRCWGAVEGLPRETWGGFVKVPSGEIVARSAYHMVWLAPDSPRIRRIVDLPDTIDMYQSVIGRLQRILVTPRGDLLTQTAHGVAVLHGGQWRTLTLARNATVSSSLMLDRSGALWVGIVGVGLHQYFGFDSTESWTTETGLPSNLVWSLARAGSTTYLATDSGLGIMDDLSRFHPGLDARAVQIIAASRDGTLWEGVNGTTLVHLDPRNGRRREWILPPMSAIHVQPDGTVWASTGRGLYRLRDDGGTDAQPVLSSPADLSITDMVTDADGTVWLTGNGCLWRRTPDGTLTALVTEWGEQGLNPQVVYHAPSGPVWVGTQDGLYRVDVAGSQVAVSRIPNQLLPSPSVMAVLERSDGSLWVGTLAGISIEKDGHWTAIDSSDGLIGNNVSQDILFEDSDHTVWVATSRGVTHITHPDEMIRHAPLQVSVLSETVNARPYDGHMLPYGPARLDLQFGVLDTAYGDRLRFRVRMDGVDPQWTDLPTGTFGYPALPSGRHDLLVEAYDPLRHTTSPLVRIPVAMAEPWWRRPWAYVAEACLLGLLIWLALRWRTARLIEQRRSLADQVSARTRELEARTLELEEARQRLEILAQRDGLTGLLNRRAVRDVFDELVATSASGLSLALIDVDHFKRINDTNGHLGGDAVLVEIARRLERAFVAGEVAGRFGGEEYVVLLPGPPDRAAENLRAIVREVADRPVFFGTRVIRFTVSGGLADVGPEETWEQALTRADEALYQAKRAGRDLIIEARRSAVRQERVDAQRA